MRIKIREKYLRYLGFLASIIPLIFLEGCQKSPTILHHIFSAPETQLFSAVSAPPTAVETTPVLAESPRPHMIRTGVPLTIGPGYTCVILAKAQRKFLHVTPIENAKLTCRNSAYAIESNSRVNITRFFLAIDNPTEFAHADSSHTKIDGLDAMVERVSHECQIMIDIMPQSPPVENIVGRKLSLLLSNYVIPDKDHLLCNQATRITSYLIPYILG